MATWALYAVAELFNPDFDVPPTLLLQGAALAVVFAGYVLGWRRELAGGLLAIAGTVAFFAINWFIVGTAPQLAAAWFAAPGVLYLATRFFEHEERRGAPRPNST